jgi:hypothetical protein
MLKLGQARCWIVRLAVGFVVVIAITFAMIQVGQHIARHRAERLLADIRSLQLENSTWSDAQKLMIRWGKWGHYDGSCDASRCDYAIRFTDWAGELPGFYHRQLLYPVVRLAMLFHAHMPYVQAEFKVQDGLVSEVSFMVWTEVPKGYGPGWDENGPEPPGYVEYKTGEYALLGFAKSTEHPRSFDRGPRDEAHQEYFMGPPSGCEGCLGFDTEFTAATSREDLDWLMGFDFSCITRWSPCTVTSDLMPVAWNKYAAERKENMGTGLPVKQRFPTP